MFHSFGNKRCLSIDLVISVSTSSREGTPPPPRLPSPFLPPHPHRPHPPAPHRGLPHSNGRMCEIRHVCKEVAWSCTKLYNKLKSLYQCMKRNKWMATFADLLFKLLHLPHRHDLLWLYTRRLCPLLVSFCPLTHIGPLDFNPFRCRTSAIHAACDNLQHATQVEQAHV